MQSTVSQWVTIAIITQFPQTQSTPTIRKCSCKCFNVAVMVVHHLQFYNSNALVESCTQALECLPYFIIAGVLKEASCICICTRHTWCHSRPSQTQQTGQHKKFEKLLPELHLWPAFIVVWQAHTVNFSMKGKFYVSI